MTPSQVKAAVRARDKFRCTKCGMTNADHLLEYGRVLDVHRTEPGSEYTEDGCVTVCKGCHGQEPRSPPHAGEPQGRAGPLVEAILQHTGWTAYRLAKESGISQQNLLAIRRGSDPVMTTVEALLTAAGLSWTWFAEQMERIGPSKKGKKK